MSIGVTGITFPTGLTALDTFTITVTTDTPFETGAVILFDGSTFVSAAPIIPDGPTALGGTAVFFNGTVPEGSLTLRVVVASATDEGQSSGGPMVVVPLDVDVHVPLTKFVNALQSTLVLSPLVPELDEDNVIVERHLVRDRDRLDPGVFLERHPVLTPFETFNQKLYQFEVHVLITSKAHYDGERDSEEREQQEELVHRIFKALEANQNLGGATHLPLTMETVDPHNEGRVINYTQFWDSIVVRGGFLC